MKTLIVTLTIQDADMLQFDRLRQQHFPKGRNYLDAHVTMFHKLPGEEETEIRAAIRELTKEIAPSPVSVKGLRFLGRGVAFDLDASAVMALHNRLKLRFAGYLTPQDAQAWRPHITVQNKVEPETARALLNALQTDFTPFTIIATGLTLWRYEDGPWVKVADVPFSKTNFDMSGQRLAVILLAMSVILGSLVNAFNIARQTGLL